MRRTGGLQGPECYSIRPDWADGVSDGPSYTIFVANVNLNDDGHLKVNVNRFSNDNVWGAGYRHRIVVPKLLFLSSLCGESFAKAFAPSAAPSLLDFLLIYVL